MSLELSRPKAATVQPLANSERDKIATLLKAVTRLAEQWSLTNDEAAALLDVSGPTWSRMKSGTYKGELDRDKITRISLLVGIFKGLRLLFNGPLTLGWIKTPNQGSLFQGRMPLHVMTDGGILAMSRVRQHIDALRGGL
ncbi:MAG: DUF2384 domain-containing protein [Rhodobacteraceae bacterium]|nr:DUF2384 domain-containing protein [Paracoccaceae bacterium]